MIKFVGAQHEGGDAGGCAVEWFNWFSVMYHQKSRCEANIDATKRSIC